MLKLGYAEVVVWVGFDRHCTESVDVIIGVCVVFFFKQKTAYEV